MAGLLRPQKLTIEQNSLCDMLTHWQSWERLPGRRHRLLFLRVCHVAAVKSLSGIVGRGVLKWLGHIQELYKLELA